MFLYITRHGESMGNLGKNVGSDPELTRYGLEGCRRLGARLCDTRFDAIIASPLIRAVQTAYEVVIRQPEQNLKIELLADLMEVGTDADYPGLPLEELKARFHNRLSVPEGLLTPAGGAFTLGQEDESAVMSRAYRVVSYVRRRFSEEDKVLVVAHGTFNSRLVAAALGRSHSQDYNYSHINTGLTLVRYIEGHAKLWFLNDVAHLENDGEKLDPYRAFSGKLP